jgi:hypothetical protein
MFMNMKEICSFFDSDVKYYQSKIRERMKLEKELRLLNLRLDKLQSMV